MAGYPLIRRLAVGYASPWLRLLGKKLPENKPCYHSVNKYRVWQCSHRHRCSGSLCQQANVTNAVKGLEKVRQNHLTLIWKWGWRQTGLKVKHTRVASGSCRAQWRRSRKASGSAQIQFKAHGSWAKFLQIKKKKWHNCFHNWWNNDDAWIHLCREHTRWTKSLPLSLRKVYLHRRRMLKTNN